MESKTDIEISNHKTIQYDRLRQSHDIRNKDPNTLTIYQRELLTRYREASNGVNVRINNDNRD